MNREKYKLYTWYPLTENEYWVEDAHQDKFPNCQTIVCNTAKIIGEYPPHVMTNFECCMSWSTMAKRGSWKFMIIEKPKKSSKYE